MAEQNEPIVQVSQEEKTSALATLKPADLNHLQELDAKIASFKTNYSILEINGEEDKEGYEKVRLALGEMRPTRTALDAERKSVTKPYAAAVKYINSQYQEKIKAIAEIEGPLKAKKDEIDDIKEKRKEEARLAEEQKINNRINELMAAGCAFDNSYYSISSPELNISEISIGVVELRTMSDELFKTFLQQVLDKSAAINAAQEKIRLEKEKAELEQKEKERIEREEFARKQQEFEQQQLEFKKQQEALKQQQDEIDRKNREEVERRQQENMKKAKEKQDARIKQVMDLGLSLSGQYNAYVFEDINIDVSTELCLLSDDEWDSLIAKITPAIEQLKAEKAEKELKEKEAELERVRQKAIADKLEEDRIAEELRKEELAKAGDKKKFEDLVSQINKISVPEMSSPTYKAKVKPIIDFLNSFK